MTRLLSAIFCIVLLSFLLEIVGNASLSSPCQADPIPSTVNNGKSSGDPYHLVATGTFSIERTTATSARRMMLKHFPSILHALAQLPATVSTGVRVLERAVQPRPPTIAISLPLLN